MGSKEEAKRIKWKGLNLEQESAKKQKTSKEVPEEVKSLEEVPEEKVSSSYQFFIDLLKHLDKEYLNQLWRLVKETLSNRPPTSDKEMELWVELNRLLYDTCGVHHVTAKDKEIFMLVEKYYPLRKGLALMMINYKLQVENYSQMANDLVLKIYKIANSPSQQVKKVATARRKVKPLPGRLHCYQMSKGNAAPPKPKASVWRTRSSSDTSITPPTAAAGPRLATSQKGKQAAKATKAKSLSALSENSTEDEGDDEGKDGDSDEDDNDDNGKEGDGNDDDEDDDGEGGDDDDADQKVVRDAEKDDEKDDEEEGRDDKHEYDEEEYNEETRD
nr:hypothetical protein [Tanacetum cinerariifolium]